MAEALAGLSRVIVESHPALVGPRVDRLLDGARSASRTWGTVGAARSRDGPGDRAPGRARSTEQAVHAGTTSRRPPAALDDRGVALRVFLLISPPFVPVARAGRLAAAFGGRGLLLRRLRRVAGAHAAGQWRDRRAGRRRIVPRARPRRHRAQLRAGPDHAQGRGRVFVDLWDLERFAHGPRTTSPRGAIASRP